MPDRLVLRERPACVQRHPATHDERQPQLSQIRDRLRINVLVNNPSLHRAELWLGPARHIGSHQTWLL